MTAPALQVRADIHDVRATLALDGELDLDGTQALRAALAECFAAHPQLLVLDLWDLRFCDCAGLNVLLEARITGRERGVDVLVEGVRPQVARLFTLARVDMEFAADARRVPPRIV
ncbi:STAS domain-containing protein [Streptomyces sp. NBC_01476]|uniref:STAS domain-containing protein n=1 Tax=Streptomyces sp. NBC_01476 TaxID=2903881 RepID=UPI002E306D5F|nr:STAS domain-containing protein [Streptomyces sp. NBC_01476]